MSSHGAYHWGYALGLTGYVFLGTVQMLSQTSPAKGILCGLDFAESRIGEQQEDLHSADNS